jgi:hypothetical protein
MLFVVIEHFKNRDPRPVRERFMERGRLLPDGMTYHASWIDEPGCRCFQIMEARDEAALRSWTNRWSDLIDFEIVPVVTPSEYWQRVASSADKP